LPIEFNVQRCYQVAKFNANALSNGKPRIFWEQRLSEFSSHFPWRTHFYHGNTFISQICFWIRWC
jgi:hypothetical protein